MDQLPEHGIRYLNGAKVTCSCQWTYTLAEEDRYKKFSYDKLLDAHSAHKKRAEESKKKKGG